MELFLGASLTGLSNNGNFYGRTLDGVYLH